MQKKILHQTALIGKRLSFLAIALLLGEQLHSNPTLITRSPTGAKENPKVESQKCNEEIANNKTPVGSCRKFAWPCGKFIINADFLYWKADEDGLEYGTKMEAGPIIGESSTTKTKILDVAFNWDPGFRVGIGYLFEGFDCWAVNLNWTRIHNHAHGSHSAEGIESQVGSVDTIISPWVNLLFELRFGASHASARWHVDLNTLDLDFSRKVPLSNCFALNPFFGLRGAWIDQGYRANYDSVFILAEKAPTFTREVTFKAKNDFGAFGLRAGSELLFRLYNNWQIFFDVAASVLYGRFNVAMKNLHDQGLGEGSVPPMPLDFKTHEHFWRTRFSFEEALGISWDQCFCCDRYRLSFRAAYEVNQWLSQNELFYTFYFRGQDTISSVPIRTQGHLGFHGIRLGFKFLF